MSASRLDIAVVVPVRNGRAYLPEAIESAWEQVPRPAEVIVVDDGSTDESGAVAEALGAMVVVQEPLGPGAARNLGVASAASELVAFLDADDRMAPGRLQVQGAALGRRRLARRSLRADAPVRPWDRCVRPRRALPLAQRLPDVPQLVPGDRRVRPGTACR